MDRVFDASAIREKFPALMQSIRGSAPVFLDGPGGTQVPKSVISAMGQYLETGNSNLLDSSFYAVQHTHDLVQEAREKAAAFVNAQNSDSIVFGANMTSITAHVSRSIANEWKSGDEIIVTALDHQANVSFWQRLAEEKGVTCHIALFNAQSCTLGYEHFETLINDKTKLIAFTLASNACGSITQDAVKIINTAQSVGALTYVDAVHYAPHILSDVQALGCDFLVCSAYKFFGPHLGFLYAKDEHLQRLKSYKVAAATNMSPECWETGTKSFEALAGFTATIDYLANLSQNTEDRGIRERLLSSYKEIKRYEESLSQAFLERLTNFKNVDLHGISNIKEVGKRTPTFALTFKNKPVKEVSDFLASNNISTGYGHFYAKGFTDALGVTDTGGVLRVGLLHYNTLEEIDRFFEVIETALK